MASEPRMEVALIQPREDRRVTSGGLHVLCYVADPTDLTMVNTWLEDHLGRRQQLQCCPSTMVVVMQVGDLGDVVFDPAIENGHVERHEGMPVFRQRVTLSEANVRGFIRDEIARISKAVESSERRIIPAHFGGGSRVRG